MRGFFSFRVLSDEDLVLPAYLLTLGEGFNAFNQRVDDYDRFCEVLASYGVQIISSHRLDDLAPVPPVTMEVDAGAGAILLQEEGSSGHDR